MRAGYSPLYSSRHVDELLRAAPRVDVLLTCEWEEGFDSLETEGSAVPPVSASPEVGRLLRACEPQYHFAASESRDFAIKPYRLSKTSLCVSRFYALSFVGDQSGAQSGCALSTSSDPLTSPPPPRKPNISLSTRPLCKYLQHFYRDFGEHRSRT